MSEGKGKGKRQAPVVVDQEDQEDQVKVVKVVKDLPNQNIMQNAINRLNNLYRSVTIRTPDVIRNILPGIEKFGVLPNPKPPQCDDTMDGSNIIIGEFIFVLKSKFILFDRRYINYNVFQLKELGSNEEPTLLHCLTAYTSSSQVGSWRLCMTEAGTRLNKFDDYVQSTVIHWLLSKFFAENFYLPTLPWAVEPNNDNPDRTKIPVNDTNRTSNNRNVSRNPLPIAGAVAVAIDVERVIEGADLEYITLPTEYVRTDNNNKIVKQILGRGKINVVPFNFWTPDKGTCGTLKNEKINITPVLEKFSQLLETNYTVETPVEELYSDKMKYITPENKVFEQTARVFRVKLNPIVGGYGKKVDIIYVHYEIRQWINKDDYNRDQAIITEINGRVDLNLEQKDTEINSRITPEINVRGFYILSVLEPNISESPYYNINQLGLYVTYIKAGYYVCKPLDYEAQCSFSGNTVNENYRFIGFRYSHLFPFNKIYEFTPGEISLLKTYSEQLHELYSNKIQRNIKKNTDAKTGLVRYLTYIAPCQPREGELLPGGGRSRKTTKNKKQYKNKLQTNKRRKCSQLKGKMKRKTKKR